MSKEIEQVPLRQTETEQELRLRAIDEIEMPATWKISNEAKGMITDSLAMYSTKHGLYAAIPIVPSTDECLYGDLCPLNRSAMSHKGERCPLEISLIMKRYDEYVRDFGIIETDVVDMGLVKDLVDYDVQLFRAENKISRDADFIEEVTIAVTEGGREITAPQISKAAEYKERIMNKKHQVLKLMNSTRADKAGDKLTLTLDPSSYAAQLMSQVAGDMKPGQIFEGEYEDID